MIFIWNGAKMYRTPLLNILVSIIILPVSVLELVDCQFNLADEVKNGTFKFNRFIDTTKKKTLPRQSHM